MNTDLGNLLNDGSKFETIVTKSENGFIVKCIYTHQDFKPNRNISVTDEIENIYNLPDAINNACMIINKRIKA